MTPAAQVFTAVQAWQTGHGSADDAADLALRLTDGDDAAASVLLRAAVASWGLVVESSRVEYVGGGDGEPIGPAHGRPRCYSWSRS